VGALSSPAGPGGARPPNAFGAFGLSKTRLVTASLVLLCDRVTCTITSHITRRQLPQRSYGADRVSADLACVLATGPVSCTEHV